MATNKFLEFLTQPNEGINVLTDAQYSTDADREGGHQGQARLMLANKHARQTSITSAALVQWIVNVANDTSNPAHQAVVDQLAALGITDLSDVTLGTSTVAGSRPSDKLASLIIAAQRDWTPELNGKLNTDGTNVMTALLRAKLGGVNTQGATSGGAGYSFDGDEDTGLYNLSDAGKLMLVKGGVSIVRSDDTGTPGIPNAVDLGNAGVPARAGYDIPANSNDATLVRTDWVSSLIAGGLRALTLGSNTYPAQAGYTLDANDSSAKLARTDWVRGLLANLGVTFYGNPAYGAIGFTSGGASWRMAWSNHVGGSDGVPTRRGSFAHAYMNTVSAAFGSGYDPTTWTDRGFIVEARPDNPGVTNVVSWKTTSNRDEYDGGAQQSFYILVFGT